MTSYIDSNNYYLSKFFNYELLNYDIFWLFYSQRDGIQMADLFPNQKVYSFLWEYSDENILIKIDEWKRAFRRNNINISLGAKLYTQNYLSADRIVYLDCLETDLKISDEQFKDLTAYNIGQHFFQIVTEMHTSFVDTNLNFLEISDRVEKFKEFVRILDTDGVQALILNGYSHNGELIKLCICNKGCTLLNVDKTLPLDIFENTFVAIPFH